MQVGENGDVVQCLTPGSAISISFVPYPTKLLMSAVTAPTRRTAERENASQGPVVLGTNPVAKVRLSQNARGSRQRETNTGAAMKALSSWQVQSAIWFSVLNAKRMITTSNAACPLTAKDVNRQKDKTSSGACPVLSAEERALGRQRRHCFVWTVHGVSRFWRVVAFTLVRAGPKPLLCSLNDCTKPIPRRAIER